MRAIRDGVQENKTILPILYEWPDQKLRPDLELDMSAEWWRAMPSLRTPSNPHGTMDIAALEKELREAADDADLNGPEATELLLSQRFGLESAERGGGSGTTQLAKYWPDCVGDPAPTPPNDATLFVGMDPSSGLSDPFATVAVWKVEDVIFVRSKQYLLKQAHKEAAKGIRGVYDRAIARQELVLFDTVGAMEEAVHADMREVLARWPLTTFCGDAAGLAGFKERFETAVGASYWPVDQGWKLGQSLELAGGLAFDRKFSHGDQPLLNANVQNLVLENGRMRKYDARSNGTGTAKIDGTMSLLSALMKQSTTPVWDVFCMVI
jgi:hypothetical protein